MAEETTKSTMSMPTTIIGTRGGPLSSIENITALPCNPGTAMAILAFDNMTITMPDTHCTTASSSNTAPHTTGASLKSRNRPRIKSPPAHQDRTNRNRPRPTHRHASARRDRSGPRPRDCA